MSTKPIKLKSILGGNAPFYSSSATCGERKTATHPGRAPDEENGLFAADPEPRDVAVERLAGTRFRHF